VNLIKIQTNGASKWQEGVDGLLNTTWRTFFPSKYGGNVMSETACETISTCDRNQICYKGFLSTWLALTTVLAPYTSSDILPKLQGSAAAAAAACSGGTDSDHCGIRWYQPKWDGTSGLEQQMATTAVFAANLVAFSQQNNHKKTSAAPLTSQNGGNSKGNPNAGLSDSQGTDQPTQIAIGTADKVGAGIVTAVFGCAWLGIIGWLLKSPT
jgi:mannan endo-1,6-alpha-mannosidase